MKEKTEVEKDENEGKNERKKKEGSIRRETKDESGGSRMKGEEKKVKEEENLPYTKRKERTQAQR